MSNLNYLRLLVMIPDFLNNGKLPSGIYECSFREIESRFMRKNSIRKNLILGLKDAMKNLSKSGVKYLYIGGSFVTEKSYPNNINICFILDENIDTALLDKCFWSFNDIDEYRKCKNIAIDKYKVDFRTVKNEKDTLLSDYTIDPDGFNVGLLKIDLSKEML